MGVYVFKHEYMHACVGAYPHNILTQTAQVVMDPFLYVCVCVRAHAYT